MELHAWALWSLAGAFCYGAPRLIVALSEARATARPVFEPLLEFAVALGIGSLFGPAVGPFVADLLHLSKGAEDRAVAFVDGLIANPIAPLVVSIVSDQVLRRLGAPLETKK